MTDMKPTTPETVSPQWVEHLSTIAKELDEEIKKELTEKPKDIMVEEKLDGKSPL